MNLYLQSSKPLFELTITLVEGCEFDYIARRCSDTVLKEFLDFPVVVVGRVVACSDVKWCMFFSWGREWGLLYLYVGAFAVSIG